MTRATLAALLLLACAGGARAFEIVAALSSDSGHYREAYEGFQEEWGSSVTAVVLGRDSLPPAPDVVVAFGSRAALKEWRTSPLIVTCLAPGARPDRASEVLSVELLATPASLMERMRKLMPRLKVLRVLWSSDFEESEIQELAEASKAQDIVLLSERVADPSRLPQALRSLKAPADALWLMPDPALVSSANFATLREYSAAARVPFLAPTEGLAEKGATATLAAPFRDAGRAAAAVLRARLRGEVVHGPAHPTRVVVTVNASAARIVGLDIKAAEGVDRVIP